MTSKYQGLPDIDTAPDIFETPDEPDTLLRPADNGLGDDEATFKTAVEGLDVASLPGRKKAQKVFGRGVRRADQSNLTFRPRLPPLSRHDASLSSESEDEAPPLPKESAVARLRRLKAELAEVESELNEGQAGSSSARAVDADGAHGEGKKRRSVLEPRKPVDILYELSGLKDRLEKVDLDTLGSAIGKEEVGGSEWKERLGRLNSYAKESKAAGDGDDHAVESAEGGASSLGEIDKRLAVLEDALGPIGDGLDQSSPLLPTLYKHDHLLTLLTHPRHLDAISRRIKLLLVDLDRAAAASRRPPGPSATQGEGKSTLSLSQGEYDSLQSLFNILPRLDPLLPIISPLLGRLRTLSGLHAESSEIVDSLRKLQHEDKQSTEELDELLDVVKKVEKGLDGTTDAVLKNWEGVEARLRTLEERLRTLEG